MGKLVIERELTEEAADLRWQWEREYGGCTCHLGRPPCGSCTHPGNPANQENDPDAWIETTREQTLAEELKGSW